MDKPKLVAEQVFERCRDFGTALFNDFAEPRAIAFIVDWEIGQDAYPAGLLISRHKESRPDLLLEMTRQLGKMNLRLLSIYDETVVNALEQYSELQDKLRDGVKQEEALLLKLKKEVEALEQRKRELESGTAPGTSNSA